MLNKSHRQTPHPNLPCLALPFPPAATPAALPPTPYPLPCAGLPCCPAALPALPCPAHLQKEAAKPVTSCRRIAKLLCSHHVQKNARPLGSHYLQKTAKESPFAEKPQNSQFPTPPHPGTTPAEKPRSSHHLPKPRIDGLQKNAKQSPFAKEPLSSHHL